MVTAWRTSSSRKNKAITHHPVIMREMPAAAGKAWISYLPGVTGARRSRITLRSLRSVVAAVAAESKRHPTMIFDTLALDAGLDQIAKGRLRHRYRPGTAHPNGIKRGEGQAAEGISEGTDRHLKQRPIARGESPRRNRGTGRDEERPTGLFEILPVFADILPPLGRHSELIENGVHGAY